jgi:hypothetical protein
LDAKPIVLKVLLQQRHLQTHRAFVASTTGLPRKRIRLYGEGGQARRSSTGGFPENWLDFLILITVAFSRECFPTGRSTNYFKLMTAGLTSYPNHPCWRKHRPPNQFTS